MYLVQTVWQNDKWTPLQRDHYTHMTVGKVCKRLTERAGIRSEYTAALKKHGSIIMLRAGQRVKLEIQLEAHEQHRFTGEARDYSGVSDTDASTTQRREVHPGRGSDSDDGRQGDRAADSAHRGDAGGVQASPRGSDEHDCSLHHTHQTPRAEAGDPSAKG